MSAYLVVTNDLFTDPSSPIGKAADRYRASGVRLRQAVSAYRQAVADSEPTSMVQANLVVIDQAVQFIDFESDLQRAVTHHFEDHEDVIDA